MAHFLNDIVNELINTKINNYFIIASLKSEPTYKLINRIPGSRILISSLPWWASGTHASLTIQQSVLEALPGKLDFKRHTPGSLYL